MISAFKKSCTQIALQNQIKIGNFSHFNFLRLGGAGFNPALSHFIKKKAPGSLTLASKKVSCALTVVNVNLHAPNAI